MPLKFDILPSQKFLSLACVGIISSFFYLIVCHTILTRTVGEEASIILRDSCLQSSESDGQSENAVGKERLGAVKTKVVGNDVIEEEKRQKRIARHPKGNEMFEYERQLKKRIFSVPPIDKKSQSEKIVMLEEKLKRLRCKPKLQEETILYALRMQAEKGDNNERRPWIFTYHQYLKWKAWKALKGQTKETCEKKYLKYMKTLIFKYGLRPNKK